MCSGKCNYHLCLWLMVLVGVLCVVAMICGYAAHNSALISEAIKAGADPIRARCGIAGVDSSSEVALCSATRP